MALPSQSESIALLAHRQKEGWWFRAKEDIVMSFIKPFLNNDTSVLLLGIGNGSTITRLRRFVPHCSILGLDIDPAAVELCASLDLAGDYKIADIEHETIAEPNSIDLVIALDILEHIENDAAVAGHVSQCLKPGGLFVVNVPAHQWLFGEHDTQLGHVRRYSPQELVSLMLGSELEIVHSTPLFMITLAILVIWRRGFQPLLRIRAGSSDVDTRFSWLIDRALYAISRFEGFIAKAWLPFGSSHFVLARKPFIGSNL